MHSSGMVFLNSGPSISECWTLGRAPNKSKWATTPLCRLFIVTIERFSPNQDGRYKLEDLKLYKLCKIFVFERLDSGITKNFIEQQLNERQTPTAARFYCQWSRTFNKTHHDLRSSRITDGFFSNLIWNAPADGRCFFRKHHCFSAWSPLSANRPY